MDSIEFRLNERWKQLIRYVLFFVVITHGYRYLQTSFNHDSLAFAASEDIVLKVSVGRFMQPVYWLIRGKVAAPYIVGLFSIIWLTPAVYYTADVLSIRSRGGQFLLTGIMAGSISVVAANASFIHEADTFLLALLLNVLAARLSLKHRLRDQAAALVLIIAGAGLYQAFSQIYVSLIMVWAIRAILAEEGTLKQTWFQCFRSAALLVLGLCLYLLLAFAVQAATGVDSRTGYNSLNNIGQYTDSSIVMNLLRAWLKPVQFYLEDLFRKVSPPYALIHLATLLCGAILTLFALKKPLGTARRMSVLAILTMFPAGMNSMYLFSDGLLHDLITCAYPFGMIFVVTIFEFTWDTLPKERRARMPQELLRRAIPILLCLLFGIKAIWANQQYLKKDLESDSTRAIVVRILDRAEQLEGFQPGQTPVHFIGIMNNSPLIAERPNFRHCNTLAGSWLSSSLTFGDDFWAFWCYFEDVMGYPIVPYTEELTPAQAQAADSMSPFPAKDSVQIVDGVALIKLSYDSLSD